MKIAIISDTHNLLRAQVKEKLQECDLILHAGDICSPAVYDELAALGKPMLTVRGNNDGRWAVEKGIPKVVDTYLSEVEGSHFDTRNLHIFMVHDRKDIPKEILSDGGGYDLVVFGHSHKYETNRVKRTLFVNPGSCGPVRFRMPVTMIVLEDKFIDVEILAEEAEVREITPGEMKTLVAHVVKDIKRNKSAEQIAKRHKISMELSEQICRLYLTHPGVTVDGILGKMGM